MKAFSALQLALDNGDMAAKAKEAKVDKIEVKAENKAETKKEDKAVENS